MVKWNEPYQKLASCDSSGIIFVWIKYEGRWSIELINDRSTLVTHFSWSHDGRMALICYQDGFVLVGSVAGQRYWSSMLSLQSTITCGIWTPDDQQVYFGTTSGQIIVMDVHGAMVSQVQLIADVGISHMAWSCEKFKMEEGDDNDPGVTNAAERKFVLAVSFENGNIYLLKTFDDVSPIQITTGLQSPVCMEWSNSRELLAIGGIDNASPENVYINILKFYNEKGTLIYSTVLPYNQAPITALTWGHNDKRLFLATGTHIHIAWVSRRIASLQLMCRLKIYNSIQQETQLSLLPLPARIRNLIGNLFAQTIRCFVPEISALRDFVSKPPLGSVRLHCTMIRHDEDNNHVSSGTCYTLYLEYLGGLVPLLKGKRTSKIRPEFVIFDPQGEDYGFQLQWSPESKSSGSSSYSTSGGNLASDSSDSEMDDGCTGSPRMQRRKKKRNKSYTRFGNPEKNSGPSSGDAEPEDLSYVDTLPEHVRLVEVTSNIWGTKFKIHGLVDSVPANLGQVTYKTSLLHLQPRQMTLVITELRDDYPIVPDPNFNPNLFSEDEEDSDPKNKSSLQKVSLENCPPIAPMSPRGNRVLRQKLSNNYLSIDIPRCTPSLAKPESYEDDSERSFRSGNSRHAVSPLCCEGSVPSLQSPKNAVAPGDIIFDRPSPQIVQDIKYKNIPLSLNLKKNQEEPKKDIKIKESQPGPSNDNSMFHNLIPADSMIRSCSVGYLDSMVDGLVPSDLALQMLRKEAPKRLVLVNRKHKHKKNHKKPATPEQPQENQKKLKNCGKSKSLDSSDLLCNSLESIGNLQKEVNHLEVVPEIKPNTSTETSPTSTATTTTGNNNTNKLNNHNNNNNNNLNNNINNIKKEGNSKLSFFGSKSPLSRRKKNHELNEENKRSRSKTKKSQNENENKSTSLHTHALATLESLLNRLREDDNKKTNVQSPRLPRSSPSSPAPSKKGKRPQSASPVRKNILSSPLLSKKHRKSKLLESSDDEVNASGDEVFNGVNYTDLETFQKAQLRQKLKRVKIEPNGTNVNTYLIPLRREFVMHNKAPMWNESSQVYQLDFGGRVTQESAKNFQIEFRGKQVMQFGRIDGNAYTLDFQYPFSALQAFAVALANVTQRLK
nr:tubby-related protein 4-like [Onthophagus taurus]